MSCRLTAPPVFIVLFLRLQSIDLTHARSFASVMPFDLPEIDGSAVDTCRIFTVPTPDTTVTITTRAPTTITPTTRKQVVVTTTKPAVQSPPRKPEPKNSGTPIKPPPAPAGPITDRHFNSLLYYLLANSRQAGFISQPIGGLPHRGYSASDSDESQNRVGRRQENRWNMGSSSEDSSDES